MAAKQPVVEELTMDQLIEKLWRMNCTLSWRKAGDVQLWANEVFPHLPATTKFLDLIHMVEFMRDESKVDIPVLPIMYDLGLDDLAPPCPGIVHKHADRVVVRDTYTLLVNLLTARQTHFERMQNRNLLLVSKLAGIGLPAREAAKWIADF